MTKEFDGMTLEQIKEAIKAKPRHIPDTVLDTAAMHAAIDRFQAEKQAHELREWLIHEAPNGLYNLYVAEKEKLKEQEDARIKTSNRFAGTIILIVLGFVIYNMYHIATLTGPR